MTSLRYWLQQWEDGNPASRQDVPNWFLEMVPKILFFISIVVGVFTLVAVVIAWPYISNQMLLDLAQRLFDITLSSEQIPRLVKLWHRLRYSALLYGMLVSVISAFASWYALHKPKKAYSLACSLAWLFVPSVLTLFMCELYVFTLPLPRSMGIDYAAMSTDPFAISRRPLAGHRILTPLLAYGMLLQGPLYIVLIIAMTGAFIACIRYYLRRYCGYSWRRAFLIAVVFSLTTPVVFQFQVPGYVDITSYLLVFCLIMRHLPVPVRLCVYLALLINHEASVFFFPGLLFMPSIHDLSLEPSHNVNSTSNGATATRKLASEIAVQLSAIAGYVAYLQVVGRSILGQVVYHTETYSPITQFVNHPSLVLAGVLIAYKLMWILPITATVHGWRSQKKLHVFAMWAFIIGALLQLPIGLDTSRLMGTAYPAFLIALFLLKNIITDRHVWAILLVTALVPPFYIQSNKDPYLPAGFHQLLYHVLADYIF